MKQFVKCAVLDAQQKNDFFEKHFPHRLILLRTFRIRMNDGSLSGDPKNDLHRCAKDASMIAIRLWMDFFCLGGMRSDNPGGYVLIWKNSSRDTDVKIQSFDAKQVVLPVSEDDRVCLAKACVVADKELAHMTNCFDKRDDDEPTLIRASEIIERMIDESLYKPYNRELPDHRACWAQSGGSN